MALFRFIGNVLWFIGGGLISFFTWLFLGLGLCITLIGIPFGLQCLKMATLILAPFGKEVVYGGKTGSFLMNILWLPFGLVLCLEQVAFGLIYCITIIGIPAGLQAFKMAKLALMPFGAEVRKKGAKVKAKPAKAKADPKQATAEATSTTAPTTASTAPAPTEPTPAQQPQSTTNTTMAATAQPAPSIQAPVDNPTQTAQPATDNPTPIVEPTEPTTQTPSVAAEPAPTEPISTDPTPDSDEKPKNNRTIIITAIVISIIVIILGVGAFLFFPFLMGNKARESAPPNFEPTAPQESTSQSPAPALVDIKIACQNDFGGEFITFGVSYINDAITAESYYCDVAGDPSQSFSVFIASDDYFEIVSGEEAMLYGGNVVDSNNFSTTLGSYIDQWLDAGILIGNGTAYPAVNFTRDNIIISLYDFSNAELSDAVINLLYPPSTN